MSDKNDFKKETSYFRAMFLSVKTDWRAWIKYGGFSLDNRAGDEKQLARKLARVTIRTYSGMAFPARP